MSMAGLNTIQSLKKAEKESNKQKQDTKNNKKGVNSKAQRNKWPAILSTP